MCSLYSQNDSAASSPVSTPMVNLLYPIARNSFNSSMLFGVISVILAKQPMFVSLGKYCLDNLAIVFNFSVLNTNGFAPVKNSLNAFGDIIDSSLRSFSTSPIGDILNLKGKSSYSVQNLHL